MSAVFDKDFADIGAIVPDFDRVIDGYYTQRIVLDEPFPMPTFITEASMPPNQAIAFHYEPCRIPRIRYALRWEWAIEPPEEATDG